VTMLDLMQLMFLINSGRNMLLVGYFLHFLNSCTLLQVCNSCKPWLSIISVDKKITIFYSISSFVTGEGANYGVDILTGGIADSLANFVWEPAVVKVTTLFLLFIGFHILIINIDGIKYMFSRSMP
jgi:hypothetical protein